jgi:hypothetical protein
MIFGARVSHRFATAPRAKKAPLSDDHFAVNDEGQPANPTDREPGSTTASTEASGGKTALSASQDDTRPPAPTVAIDGKDIKGELEFGAKKAPAAKAPAQAVEPGIHPR